MTVTIAGKRWNADAEKLLREHYERTEIKRARMMLACAGCKSLCTIPSSCECCDKVGKTFGGKRVRTISLHDRFPIDEVLTVLRQAVAA